MHVQSAGKADMSMYKLVVNSLCWVQRLRHCRMQGGHSLLHLGSGDIMEKDKTKHRQWAHACLATSLVVGLFQR